MSQLLFVDAVEIMPVGISHQLSNLIDFHVRVHIQASGFLHPEPGDIVDKIDAHDLLEYPAEIIPGLSASAPYHQNPVHSIKSPGI